MSNTYYQLNTKGLSSEDFGGEMVAVNFETGQYYGINGVAVAVWTLLQKPISSAQAIDKIKELYTSVPEHVADDINSFIEELARHDLLVSGAIADLAGQHGDTSADTLEKLAGTAYAPPSIEVYSDLQELIMLDPVHEVDPERGWPLRREAASDNQAAAKAK